MARSQRCGFLSLLYSIGDKPLNLWSKHVSLDGRIRRVEDQALRGDKVIEIMGPLQTPVPTNISCPSNPTDVLNIKLPILVLVVKNVDLVFKLEFQLMDRKSHRRQFCLTTQSNEKPQSAHTNTVCVPLKLDEGWNNLEINLQTLCSEVHGSDFKAIQRIIIYPNCRLRRVYFQDRHYEQDETPVELCQAFFDMYMLKWGINLVERSCQTEELYTGPLQPCDLEYIATQSNMSVSVTTAGLPVCEDIRMSQIRRAMGKGIEISMSSVNSKTVVTKNSSKSVYQLGEKPKITGHQLKLISNDVVTDKRKATKSSDGKKNHKQTGHKTKKSRERADVKDKLVGSESLGQSLSFKDEKGMVKLFPHIVKSEYLKSQIGEHFSSPNSEKNVDSLLNSYVCNEKSQEVESEAGEEERKKLNTIDSVNLDRNLSISKKNCVPSPKIKCVHNTKAKTDVSVKKLKTDPNAQNDLSKVETHHGDGLLSHSVRAIEEVINEVQKIREQLINYDIDRKIPSAVAKEASNDLSEEVPPVVEVQATSSDERPKNTVLSTDKAVCDFLELRHAVNKKILERLKDKGLTITEVELSIYNSKNRRNCYGQGKLIASGKDCTSKASGLSSVVPLKMDASLKKEQSSLNDKICIQLRNELDAALLQLKSTQVRVTPEMVEDTIGHIVKNDAKKSGSDFFTVKEAQSIRNKVFNENMLKQDTETAPNIQRVKNGKNPIQELLKNLDKYSGAEIVNVLFQRQTYDSEAGFRSI